jgi:hypothetical protein
LHLSVPVQHRLPHHILDISFPHGCNHPAQIFYLVPDLIGLFLYPVGEVFNKVRAGKGIHHVRNPGLVCHDVLGIQRHPRGQWRGFGMGVIQSRIVYGRATGYGSGKGFYSGSYDIIKRLLIGHRTTRCVNRYKKMAGFFLFGLEFLFGQFCPHPSKRPYFRYLFEEAYPNAHKLIREGCDIIKIKAPIFYQQATKLVEHRHLHGKSLGIIATGLLKVLT